MASRKKNDNLTVDKTIIEQTQTKEPTLSAEREKITEKKQDEDKRIKYVNKDNSTKVAIRSAMLSHTYITATISGVSFKKGNLLIEATYCPELNQPVSVYIPIDKFGIERKSVINSIKKRYESMNIKVSESQINTEFEKRASSTVTKMLGAEIDVVPTAFLEDDFTVVGDRAAALEIKKQDFKPTKHSPIPKKHIGAVGNARILLVNLSGLLVEFSGFIVRLPMDKVTPLAVDVLRTYYVGDTLPVRVIAIKEDYSQIALRSLEFEKIDIDEKLNEYSRGGRVIATVVNYQSSQGKYVLRLPNGCKGIAYVNKQTILDKPQIGDRLICYIRGISKKEKSAIKCSISRIQ